MGVLLKIVLCNMNKICVMYSYIKIEIKVDFEYGFCIVMVWEVKKRDIEWCVFKEFKEGFFKGLLIILKMNLYYVIVGIGGILLIVFIIGFIFCRRNILIF